MKQLAASLAVMVTLALGTIAIGVHAAQDKGGKKVEGKELEGWTTEFFVDKSELTHTGRNTFFILEPGYYIIIEGGGERHTITVLNETKMVDGVECRVVEEKETQGGKIVEISKNYYAISKKTGSVYYLGEDVDVYKDGKVTGHPGTWHSGVKGAKFGLMMAGTPLVGGKYYQEIAPANDAMDRAEILSVSETVVTKAGTFKNCLKTEETTPLEKGKTHKWYAPGVGLVGEDKMRLVEYGFLDKKK